MLTTEKQSLQHWKGFVKRVHAATLTDDDEDEDLRKARVRKLEANPEDWFRYYFPLFATAPPAAFHIEAAKRVLNNPEWCEARIWSRELAKSTRTMMEVFFLTFVGHATSKNVGVRKRMSSAQSTSPSPCLGVPRRTRSGERLRKRCVLLISNSLDNAARLLAPYRSTLERNERLRADYGPQLSDATWTATEFITDGGVAFRAVGVGQSPRGTRNEEARPHIIIFDDVDTDAECLNPELVKRKWRWIEEAAIGTRSVSMPTTIIFCGNRIARDSCISRAADIADHTDVVNIRNEYGASSWPEKNTEADIDRVLSQKSYAAQQKEYFNNPVTEGSVFSSMTYKPARAMHEYSMLVCYTDPSYKNTADFKATVLVGRWNGEFHVLKCYLEQATTAQMIDWHYRVMDITAGCACYFFMEDVFMQDVLIKEISDAGKRNGRAIPIRGDTRRKPDKYMRIESLLEPLNRNGELYLNEAERHNPHMMRLAEQFCAFAAGGSAHDDGPDAVEGAVWIINQKQAIAHNAVITVAPRIAHSKRF